MVNSYIRRVSYILTLLVAVLVAAPYILVTTGLIDRLSQFVTISAFVVTVMAVLLDGRLRRPLAAHWLITLFFIWQLAGVFWSGYPDATLYRCMVNFEFLIDIWLFWEVGAMYDTRTIGQAYVLGAFVSAADVFRNYLAGTAMREDVVERYVSFGHDPNEVGLRLVIAILLVILLSKYTRSRALKLVNYAGAILCCFAVLLTGSRTAFVILAIPVIALIFSVSGTRRIAAIMILIAILVAVPYVVPRDTLERVLSTETNIRYGEFSEREFIWQSVPALFGKSPVIGLGANTFALELDQMTGQEITAHNAYLSALVEEGAIGFLIFLGIIIAIFRTSRYLEKRERLLWIGMLAAWAIGSLTMSLDFELITWVLFGLLISSSNPIRPLLIEPIYPAPGIDTAAVRAGRKLQ